MVTAGNMLLKCQNEHHKSALMTHQKYRKNNLFPRITYFQKLCPKIKNETKQYNHNNNNTKITTTKNLVLARVLVQWSVSLFAWIIYITWKCNPISVGNHPFLIYWILRLMNIIINQSLKIPFKYNKH